MKKRPVSWEEFAQSQNTISQLKKNNHGLKEDLASRRVPFPYPGIFLVALLLALLLGFCGGYWQRPEVDISKPNASPSYNEVMDYEVFQREYQKWFFDTLESSLRDSNPEEGSCKKNTGFCSKIIYYVLRNGPVDGILEDKKINFDEVDGLNEKEVAILHPSKKYVVFWGENVVAIQYSQIGNCTTVAITEHNLDIKGMNP